MPKESDIYDLVEREAARSPVGMVTEAFPDSGIGFSFATDHPAGFGENDLRLIQAVLPAVALAIVSDAEHTIAAGLLAAYLGDDAGPMPVWLNVGRSKAFKPSCGMPMSAVSLHSPMLRRGQFLLKCSTIYSRR